MDYVAHDAVGLAGLVESGEVTPGELLDQALALAQAWNPHINALTGLRPERARAAIAAGLPPGPLRGVPFLIKDLGLEAADFPASAGSRLAAGTVHPGDAELFARLCAAGLVTFGRTTTPEFGIGAVTEAAVYGGPTRNPWDRARSPGGSSGGAAAAVAAGIVPAAHGSDGGGSIRIPAACCGLVGFKATRARLPDGPFSGEGWGGMAIDGFLSRTLRDTAALLDATHGPDEGAPYWPPPLGGSFRGALDRPPPRLRVALCATTFEGDPVHPDCAAAARAAGALLESLGHRVEEARPQIDIRGMMSAWTRIVACGTALTVRRLLRGRPLADDDIEPVARAAVELAAGIPGADYLAAIDRIHAFGRAMARFFRDHDILLSPTLAEPPCLIGRFAHANWRWRDFVDYREGPEGIFAYSPFTAAFNASGQPAVSLPLHRTAGGLPVGVHLAARFGEDRLLMALCGEIERAAPWPTAPAPLPV
ncbi:MAG: 6-aminohexanoate-cyclic-dimer hydrolase [Paracoccaceae bacterium]|nr:MAG: 6-aminohexanoate-cyclic-dimer hydrolase [Paracoccaceae bacterium]